MSKMSTMLSLLISAVEFQFGSLGVDPKASATVAISKMSTIPSALMSPGIATKIQPSSSVLSAVSVSLGTDPASASML